MSFEFTPIKTRLVKPPKDDIYDIIDALPKLHEKDIVFITSKIMGIHQGRTVLCSEVDKTDLIKQEADYYLNYNHPSGFNVNLTINDNVLIPAAGIDASNADGYYIMWPKDCDKLCSEIRSYLCKKNNIKDLGVISTDSHTTPLRYGVTGLAIGLAGVEPLKDYRGHKDLFGRELAITQVDEIDALASMAVLLMGESDECTPIVLLRGWDKIVFNDKASMADFKIEPEQDLYTPLLSVMQKTK
ncbi:MAG: coenzyme F420-0:L-glutamate ligase [Alphaproteobacteria bacterium]|nr:coenzyme F420-0:L-glutamate ligase [Alphaproteobacteria bacterium]